ncbi:Membrane protein involved in the export of O-antigen and teichoic acid [Roseivivax lentus]|uniref:Membrane protein involved in the export of O-antigen and teichoic acid n=1 Tax=Roseivivax lentus TaxID=633194 RepID=A0A1N7P6N6_9RHOB|nr:oligosaccharide flippase family protein [Roseivivax lentus]SIT06305.1 Membrane protein involved in the export of O-antigen and teichoic acid [Roseivivax lentus]
MSGAGWAALLQWSRVGLSAFVFLLAARLLPIEEIGRYAVLLAPIRLFQNALRVGLSETVILGPDREGYHRALSGIGMAAGALATLGLGVAAWGLGMPLLAALAPLPFLGALGAVAEGILRKRMNLRALAIRTALAQTFAALVAGIALWRGAGIEALALFAVVATGTASFLALRAAPIGPVWPSRRRIALLRRPAQITCRDMLSSGLYPLAQVLVGAVFGLAAAGAFQMAVRLVQLTEALTLAPLKFAALPALRRVPGLLSDTADATARIAFWAWPGLYVAAPDIALIAVGPAHAEAVAPVLRALAPFGLFCALSMPWLQAVAAARGTRFLLWRSAALLLLSGGAIWLSRDLSVIAAAHALAVIGCVFWAAPFAVVALRHRGVAPALPRTAIIAGTCMMIGLMPLLALPPSPLRLGLLLCLGSAVYAGVTRLMAFRPGVVPT